MATWEDGPEYAPAQRPASFTEPAVNPLESPQPQGSLIDPSPAQRPQFAPSASPGPALDQLVPATLQPARDPHAPFEVTASTLTTGSSWSPPASAEATAAAPQDSLVGQPSGGSTSPVTSQSSVNPGWGPPTGSPAAPIHLPENASHGVFPAPGSVGWFGPPPTHGQPEEQPNGVVETLTLGYIIVLALTVTYFFAPILFVIGAFLSRQVKGPVAQLIRRIAAGAGVLNALIALMILISDPYSFGDWWSGVATSSLFLGLLLLIVSIVVVRIRTPHQPHRSTWG